MSSTREWGNVENGTPGEMLIDGTTPPPEKRGPSKPEHNRGCARAQQGFPDDARLGTCPCNRAKRCVTDACPRLRCPEPHTTQCTAQRAHRDPMDLSVETRLGLMIQTSCLWRHHKKRVSATGHIARTIVRERQRCPVVSTRALHDANPERMHTSTRP